MRGLLHSPERNGEPFQPFEDALHFDSCHRTEIIPATALQGANFHSFVWSNKENAMRVDLVRDTENRQRQRQRHTALAVMTQTRSVKGKDVRVLDVLYIECG